ncbi:Membrane protein involved in the export of O-antigen and teichoic acid-like protein [Sphingomonas paucimobilis]|uniref:lipopolysaccharide biosynthesis protein n=1 Tax=Sphingobium sp. DC-2 TaxID=1303256 RepID=UPI00044FE1ED|nr:teichoic acid transporter [Sphingobium sp. DC-2]EZP70031.1 Membrane protein involved in the export of O-antigen and teichoic acid-like protein [Sphingomonas paucimobilis]
MRRRIAQALSTQAGRRLSRVMSAQFLNQATTIILQIGLVPVLLYAWGKQSYGVWLLLSAVPTYLTFSDFGFTLIAKNEMLMQVAGGRREEALRTFHSVFALLNLVMPCLIGLSVLLICSVDLSHALNLGEYANGDARAVLILLLLNVVSYQYFLLICGGVRCENRLAMEASWGALSRLAEGLAVAGSALLGGGLVAAAAAALITKLLGSVGLYLWLRKASPWLSLGHAKSSAAEIKRLLKPALAFMLMPISQSMLIQAPLMIIGVLIGPAAVVTFATTRTLARTGTAITNLLNGTVQGEYSIAFGRANHAMLHKVLRYHQRAGLAAIIAFSVPLYLFRDPLMRLYTHGQVSAVDPFFLMVILTVAAEMMWSSIATPLSSINRHVTFANLSLLISLAGIGLCYVFTLHFGLNGAAAAMLTVHGAILVLSQALRHAIRLPHPPLTAREAHSA